MQHELPLGRAFALHFRIGQGRSSALHTVPCACTSGRHSNVAPAKLVIASSPLAASLASERLG